MDTRQTIVDVYEELASTDAEMMKVAEEEDAAGRIMARGFADELHKLAAVPNLQPTASIPSPRYSGMGGSLSSSIRGLRPASQPRSSVTLGKVRRVQPSQAPRSSVTLGRVRRVQPSQAPRSSVTLGKVRRVQPSQTVSAIPEKKPMSLGPRKSLA